MYTRILLFLLAFTILLTLSLTYGQERTTPPAQANATDAKPPLPGSLSPLQPSSGRVSPTEIARLSPLQQQMVLAAQRGFDWLARMNGDNGRFLHGWLPAVKAPMEGDHYLRQVGSAYALARAARFTREDKYNVLANQALLSLLDETLVDSRDAQVRFTFLPSILINRVGAAGYLVLAIHELPEPQKDLLDKSEQLCNFIRKQARPDGSLCCADAQEDGKPGTEEADAILHYPGPALCGLMRSQRHRPAAWKTELVRKALGYYHPWWKSHRTMAFVPWQSAAYAEAYQLTRDKAFADCVLEMNDWMCDLQYNRIDPRHQLWFGGFKSCSEDRVAESAPQIDTAHYAEGLAEACRVARQAGDQARLRRYRETLERSLQFLSTLQYTDANTLHFTDWYRQRLVGAFHASHHDGNLRIDYTQHAVCALLLYLDQAGP